MFFLRSNKYFKISVLENSDLYVDKQVVERGRQILGEDADKPLRDRKGKTAGKKTAGQTELYDLVMIYNRKI